MWGVCMYGGSFGSSGGFTGPLCRGAVIPGGSLISGIPPSPGMGIPFCIFIPGGIFIPAGGEGMPAGSISGAIGALGLSSNTSCGYR